MIQTWAHMVKTLTFLMRFDSLATMNLRRAIRVDQRSRQLYDILTLQRKWRDIIFKKMWIGQPSAFLNGLQKNFNHFDNLLTAVLMSFFKFYTRSF